MGTRRSEGEGDIRHTSFVLIPSDLIVEITRHDSTPALVSMDRFFIPITNVITVTRINRRQDNTHHY